MNRAAAGRAAEDDAGLERVARVTWDGVESDLDANGFAVVEKLLDARRCQSIAALYPEDRLYRKHVIMARHGYGSGEYKYFTYPLPGLIAGLRAAAYPYLARLANRWNAAMQIATRYPDDLETFLKRCHKAGQKLPTPLLLKYGPGDFNCLHQDLYGEHAFTLQLAVLLSEPGRDFLGGEFVLTEQRPRMQSRARVVPLSRGDAVIFPVNHRPVQGGRKPYRVNVRHGVSALRSGSRYTLGVIFHDAKS